MTHSKNYAKVKRWYDLNAWDETRVRNAVIMKWITKEEYSEITGNEYGT